MCLNPLNGTPLFKILDPPLNTLCDGSSSTVDTPARSYGVYSVSYSFTPLILLKMFRLQMAH